MGFWDTVAGQGARPCIHGQLHGGRHGTQAGQRWFWLAVDAAMVEQSTLHVDTRCPPPL